jgi:predicted TIM-barrel fold metal-dependent hydrolase
MQVIDADAHVIEYEDTWSAMTGDMAKYKPKIVKPEDGKTQYWVIDGRIFNRRGNVNRMIPAEITEMRDIDNRLRHMDQLGVDVQVLYPSLFLRPVTTKPAVETALFRSYNRWMADVYKKGGGRLRWVAMAPLMELDQGIEEARFAKENGACGIFMRGIADDRLLSDPYLFPLYEEAARLNLPICVHASSGNFDWMELFERESGFAKFKMAVLSGFHSIAYEGVPSRFPGLRFGFIEVRAQWVPYMITDIKSRFEQKGKTWNKDFMRDSNLYVACQSDDDLPWVLRYSGDDNLVIGSDYGHADTSSELEVFQSFAKRNDIGQDAVTKILSDNAKALYAL